MIKSSFQQASVLQGRWFVENVSKRLISDGFLVTGTWSQNCDLVGFKNEEEYYFICCGSMRGKVPGFKRTDSLKKAIADAWILSVTGHKNIRVVSNHYPDKGVGKMMLNLALDNGLFQIYPYKE